MKKKGILNRDISGMISKVGHKDTICVCDAGFPIPDTVQCVDVSLSDNNPGFIEVLKTLLQDFAVEKIIISEDTRITSPSMYKKLRALFPNIECEEVPHTTLKEKSKSCKGIIRTAEFTSFSNVILVSGTDDSRWFKEV